MKTCYRCEEVLNSSNTTIEHIIPNACGGRLKTKNLLCKSCNSTFGSSSDKELADQTNELVSLLFIKRERGEAQPIKAKVESKGADYYFYPNDKIEMVKPFYNHVVNGDHHQLSIKAPNKKVLMQILNSIKRKYPTVDIEKILNSANDHYEKIDEEIEFNISVGGAGVFRAIAKIAISYFIFKGGEREYIKHLLAYIDGTENMDIVWMHYTDNPIYIPIEPNKEVSHIIRLIGDPKEKILYAYIELFNCQNYIIKLSESYTGEFLDETYVYDLFELEEINRTISMSYSREELLNFFTHKDLQPFANVKKAFGRVINISAKRKNDFRINKAIDTAWKSSLGKYPVGTIITQEMANELEEHFFKEIMPLLVKTEKR